ncbi:MAG: D-alanyl-D-alanine carboxypeptidase family protein [Actinomycetes bacterium]
MLLAAALVAPVLASTATAAPPTAAEVAEQRTEADRLREQADDHEGEVAAAQTRLAELSSAAGAALERYTVAVQQQAAAEAAHWEESERLSLARSALDTTRGDLGRWAAQTYRDGAGTSTYEGFMTLLEASSPEDLSERMVMLEVVGRSQGGTVKEADEAARSQADAALRAEQTSMAVREATEAAVAAKAESDRLVAAQREEVARLEALLAASQGAAADAEAEAKRLAQARAAVERGQTSSARPTNLDGINTVTGATGDCRGTGVERYPNGQIPASALCPLWGAPGHLLRADAAYAFDRLAEAYASAFGEPICVTDSYRTYEAQVRLRAAKPHLAAVPGTSNHGWGTAVDLCGGIQRFGTAEYQWMQLNAPLYGWFNPAWAQQGGSKPEPWHWEFGG